jgi:nicotinamide/nicotinate riboside kinase
VEILAEGTWWRDPPGYWENVAYPAYKEASKQFFEGGDVEQAPLSEKGKAQGLMLIEGLERDMGEIVGTVCKGIMRVLPNVSTTQVKIN